MSFPVAACCGHRARANSPFSVPALPGIQAWLRADAGAYSDTGLSTPATADGTTVAGWEDQFGNNDFLASGIGSSTGFTLKTGVQNGLNVLRSNGTSNLLRNTTLGSLLQGTQPFTLFLVASQATTTGTQLALSWNTSTSDNDYGYVRLRNSNQQTAFRKNNDAGANSAVNVGTDVCIVTLTFDGTTLTIRTNGGTAGTCASGSNGSTINQLILGGLKRNTDTNGTFFAGIDFCELIVCNQVLSSTVQANCVSYLARWAPLPGIPGSLAGTGGSLQNYLSWTAPTNGIRYLVQRSPAGAGTYTTVATDLTTLYYFDTGLASNTAYDYKVFALNQFGRQGTAATVTNVTTISGSFDPTKFGRAPRRWGKPDALGLSDGTAIQTDTDQGSVGNNFVQGTLASRPLYKTGIQNGLGMALYDGSNDFMTCDGMATMFNGVAPFSVFKVIKLSALGNPANDNRNLFIAANVAGSSTPTIDLYYAPFSNALVHTDRRDSAGAEYSVGFGDPDTSTHVVGIIYNGSQVRLCLDGTLLPPTAHGSGTLAADSLTKGAHRRVDGTTAFWNGYIGEETYYDWALSELQAGQLCDYLRTRWATPSGMASDPSQFANLNLWWRSDALNGFQGKVDGDTYSTGTIMYCKVGYLHDLELAGTATYKTNIFGARSALLLGATSALLEDVAANIAAHFTGGIPFTLFWTAKATSTAADASFWSLTNNGASNAFQCARLKSTPAYGVGTQNDAGTANAFTGGTADTSGHSYIYTYDGRTSTLYVDGTTTVVGAQSAADAAFTLVRFVFGGLYRGSLSEPFPGYLGEVGGISRLLSGAELTTLYNYQQAYWGTP